MYIGIKFMIFNMNKIKVFFFISFLFIFLFSLSFDINKPFLDSTNDSEATLFAPAAIHWLRFGPINLKFLTYITPSLDNQFLGPPYTNHPQFIIFPFIFKTSDDIK